MRIPAKTFALVAALGALACYSTPRVAHACHCNAHFEILDKEAVEAGETGGFKPDAPEDHFSAHQTRRRGETDNQCRRRARDAAHACMSALWRDRWRLQESLHRVPECWQTLPDKINHVIRPIAGVTDDVKRDLENAACCGDSPWRNKTEFHGAIYKRVYGDRGCGPKLGTRSFRFLSDYTFDCKSVRARENCGRVELSGARDEEGYDRPGADLPGMPIADVTSAANCRNRCIKEHRCRAWTWVKPGFQGPAANCWLKETVPWARKNDCCLSGTVR